MKDHDVREEKQLATDKHTSKQSEKKNNFSHFDVVGQLHENLGNRIVCDALSGEDAAGFSELIAGELFLHSAGMGEAFFGSNLAMQSAMSTPNTDSMALLRHARAGSISDAQAVASLLQKSRGAPLPTSIRSRFSAAMSHDFSGVKIHTDAAAAQAADKISAHAFTVERDIYMGQNSPMPGTSAGDELLAHELTHVMQYDEGRLPTGSNSEGLEVSSPGDAVEQEAYAVESTIHKQLEDVDARLENHNHGDSLSHQATSNHSETGGSAQQSVMPAIHRDKDTAKTASNSGNFERGDLVQVQGGKQGIVLVKLNDAYIIQYFGDEANVTIAAEQLESLEGGASDKSSTSLSPGSFAQVLCQGEWKEGIIVSVKTVAVETRAGTISRKRAVAYARHGDKVLMDSPASVVTHSPELASESKFSVETEIYAQFGEEEWKLGTVVGVNRSISEAIIVDSGTDVSSDGWVYTLRFDSREGAFTDSFELDQLHAKEDRNGGGGDKSSAEKNDGEGKKKGDATKEEVEGSKEDEQEGTVGDAGGTQTPEQQETSGDGAISEIQPVTVTDQAFVSPAPSAVDPDISVPSVVPVHKPSAEKDGGRTAGNSTGGTTTKPSSGKDAPDPQKINIQNLKEVQRTMSTLQSQTQGLLSNTNSTAQTIVDTTSQTINTATSTFQSSTNTAQSQITATKDQSINIVDEAVKTSKSEVKTKAATTKTAIKTATTQLSSDLKTQSTELEAEVQQNEAKYATQIDAAIEKAKLSFASKIEVRISTLEKEAKKDEEKAETFSNNYSGSRAAAEKAAEELSKADVKKKYAKAIKKLLDSCLKRIDEQKGSSSLLLAGKLTAPTLSQVWPAKDLYESEQKKHSEAKEKEVTQATIAFATVTSQDGERKKEEAQKKEEKNKLSLQKTTTSLEKTSTNATEHLNTQTQKGVSVIAEQERQRALTLQEEANKIKDTPLSEQWSGYIQEYLTEQNNEAQGFQQNLQDHNIERTELITNTVEQAKNSAQEKSDISNQEMVQENQIFADQTNAKKELTKQRFAGTEEDIKQTTQGISGDSKKSRTEESNDIDTQFSSFLENKVVNGMLAFEASAEQSFADLDKKKETDLQGAKEKGISKEKSDRKRRSKSCREAAEYTWGTDEAKYMRALSGLKPAQGLALQIEYQYQFGEGLRDRIVDETSGSLKSSLLAWTRGNASLAAQKALDYAANSFWGADVEVAEAALLGLDDKQRESLKDDAAFEKARGRLLERINPRSPYGYSGESDSIAALSDMSLNKEEAEITADAAKLVSKMGEYAWGTDEKAVFEILGKRDAEGNKKLSEAYAKYVYEGQREREEYQSKSNKSITVRKKWDELSDEEKTEHSNTSLSNDIRNEFEYSNNEDRALSLQAGNKGAARAAQLRQSAVGFNDIDDALDATKNDGMSNGETWMDRVDSTQEQANFHAAMDTYDKKGALSQEDITSGTTLEGQRKNADIETFAQNKEVSKNWVNEEYGASDSNKALTGDDSGSSLESRMLNSQIETGQADAVDQFAYGVDTSGTRERFVTQALSSIANEVDANVRLSRLQQLGGYCSKFIAENNNTAMKISSGRVAKGMGKLPGYIANLENATNQRHQELHGAIRNVMIVLDYETDGGDQFDMELLVVQATMREHNVHDKWTYANEKLKSHFNGMSLGELRNDPSFKPYLNQANKTQEQITQELADRVGKDDEFGNHAERLKIGDQHKALMIIQMIRVETLFNSGADQWYEKDSGWVKKDADGGQSKEHDKQWDRFCEQIDRIDTAASDVEANNAALVGMITMVVSIVAGALITAISFGAGSVVAAGLIAAAITMTAGAINIAVKSIVLGDRYGHDEFLTDIGSMVADAVLNVVTMGAGKFIGIGTRIDNWVKTASKFKVLAALAGEIIKTSPGAFKNLFFNEDFWRGDNMDKILQDQFLEYLSSIVGGYAGNSAEALLEGIGVTAKTFTKAIGNIADGISGLAVNPANWNDEIGFQILQVVGKAGLASLLSKVPVTKAGRWVTNGLNQKDDLTTKDWTYITDLPEELRAHTLAGLSTKHKSSLAEKAVNEPDLYAALAEKAGVPPSERHLDAVAHQNTGTEEGPVEISIHINNEEDVDQNIKNTENSSSHDSDKAPEHAETHGNENKSNEIEDAESHQESADKKVQQNSLPQNVPQHVDPTVSSQQVTHQSDYIDAKKLGYKGSVETATKQFAKGLKYDPAINNWVKPQTEVQYQSYLGARSRGMDTRFTEYRSKHAAGWRYDPAVPNHNKWVKPKDSAMWDSYLEARKTGYDGRWTQYRDNGGVTTS